MKHTYAMPTSTKDSAASAAAMLSRGYEPHGRSPMHF